MKTKKTTPKRAPLPGRRGRGGLAPVPRELRLVLVDAGPIRAEWLHRLEHVRVEEARWEARLKDFERQGRPAFEAWLQKHFASLRADLLHLVEEIRGFEMVAAEVCSVADRLGISEGRAYAIVKGLIPDPSGFLGRLRAGEVEVEDEDGSDQFAGDDFEEFDELKTEDLPPGMKEFAREMFVDFLRSQGLSRKDAERAWRETEEEESGRKTGQAPRPRAPSAGKRVAADSDGESVESRAREMFRHIARRLHPDAGAGPMDERKLGLWHAAQQAWERKDVAALEAVLWETEPDAAARGQAPVGTVARVVHAVRERIKELSRQWEAIRQTPAGKLVGMDAKQRERFRREFERQLQRDLQDGRYARSELLEREWEWARVWEVEAARELRKARKPQRRSRKEPAQIELPF